jgi:Xaa-Pro aminopeptidase
MITRLKAYTKEQTKAIESAWFALMRAVESSNMQELRLREAYKADHRDFGPVATRAHILGYVAQGLRPAGPHTISNLCMQRNEIVLCYMVGQYLCYNLDYPHKLAEELAKAGEAEREAQEAFLETLQSVYLAE